MSTDLDDLLTAPPRPGGKECATGWAIQHMTDDDADKVRAILARKVSRETARALADAFARRGLGPISAESIVRHANGGCRNCAERAA